MNTTRPLIAAAALLTATMPGIALAQGQFGLGSPVRPQLELTTHLTERLDIRFGLNQRDSMDAAMGWNDDSDTDSLGLSASALVDWQFSAQGLRLTGGALYGDLGWSNYGSFSSSSYGDGVENQRYGLRDGDGADITPYLGLGWNGELGDEGRLGLQFDMGLMFDSINEAGNDNSARAAAMEEESILRQEFESFRYTPMISAGVHYRF